MTVRLLLLVPLSAAIGGCALHATAAPVFSSSVRGGPKVEVGLGLSTHVMREAAPTLGLHMHMVADDGGLVPRNGMLRIGYDWRVLPGFIVLEPAIDLGVGEPGEGGFDGLGAYAGARFGGRVRVFGVNDDEPAFNVVAPSAEVVLGVRAGGWLPREAADSARVASDIGLELGVRIAFGSDVVTPVQGRIREAEEISEPTQGDPP